ncbi:MAG: ATP-binding domain-containing protein, partial [Eggerthellaceae bacterium]|nr:ATP-binding domain-containing protein [Eggerthellaceae bacterium]MCL2826980.1 ATP-binding domain-containing protein [Eggerthellaceae bacterium]
DMMIRAGVPYRIVGGTRFFDRAEIRDVMAYLSLVANPADDIAAKRVINVPRRSIGKTTIERIERIGWKEGVSFMQAAELALADDSIRLSTRQKVGEFVQIITEGQNYSGDLRILIEMIVEKSGLIAALEREAEDGPRGQEAQSRIENIKEFFGVAGEYAQSFDDDQAGFAAPVARQGAADGGAMESGSPSAAVEGAVLGEESADGGAPPMRTLSGSSLADFLEWVRLRTDLDALEEGGAAVTLMTVHASKGLEFDNVFVAGMEETLFPHLSSASDPEGIEEERRLAYVAITRARKKLCLTYASMRQLFGEDSVNPVSRFVTEIPSELRTAIGVGSAGFSGTGFEKRGSRRGIAGSGNAAGEGRVFGGSGSSGREGHGFGAGISSDDYRKPAALVSFDVGDTVEHKVFGRGKIIAVDGDTLEIEFASNGKTKKLKKEFAPIIKVG